ncbi:MAG: hypothetical protein MIO90_06265 [Methanomassiliicoccales archaeon]|nr:hypothetical protein [Methanomassiliicoccales archaeon]
MRGTMRFRGIKKTPKNMEKEMLATSKRLADDPSLIIPRCLDQVRKSPFARVEKDLDKVLRYKDDPERLIKLAARGDQLVRAYAAAISLSASGKLPYLTTADLPTGVVSFAMRGKVDREKLIGIQHFDDPDLRLLAYWDIAREKKMHIYSAEKGLFCSISGPKAPEEYVKEMLENLPYRTVDGSCGHNDRAAVRIHWTSANKEIRVCVDCASDVNTAHHLMARVAAPEPFDDLKVSVEHAYIGGRPECKGDFSTPPALIEKYLQGELDDAGLIAAYVQAKGEWMCSRGKIYILGQECFGQDGEAFLNALKGNELERKALQAVIAGDAPIVSGQNQAGKVIGEIWEAHGRTMLAAVSDDMTAARVMDMKELTPGQMMAEASRLVQEREVLCSLPDLTQLGPLGQLADSLARAYKVDGAQAMLRLIERSDKEHRSRAICFAFLEAVGEGPSRKWQFSNEEREYGAHLSSMAKAMVASCGEEYHQALLGLLRDSGSGETAVKAP